MGIYKGGGGETNAVTQATSKWEMRVDWTRAEMKEVVKSGGTSNTYKVELIWYAKGTWAHRIGWWPECRVWEKKRNQRWTPRFGAYVIGKYSLRWCWTPGMTGFVARRGEKKRISIWTCYANFLMPIWYPKGSWIWHSGENMGLKEGPELLFEHNIPPRGILDNSANSPYLHTLTCKMDLS